MRKGYLDLAGTRLPLGGVTHVMGVINASPESKNTHTLVADAEEAVRLADRYRRWGASLIDLGGQSSHYANPTIAAEEEARRVIPIAKALAGEGHLVSIDTWKPLVARLAVEAGVVVINDTGGMADPEMRAVAAQSGVAAVAVYIEGANPHQVGEISTEVDKNTLLADHFRSLMAELAAAGVDNVIIDPGIALNYQGDYLAYTDLQLRTISELEVLADLGRPVLVPIPRKRDFHRVAAFVALALEHGADLIRVHDVAMACDLVRLFGRTP